MRIQGLATVSTAALVSLLLSGCPGGGDDSGDGGDGGGPYATLAYEGEQCEPAPWEEGDEQARAAAVEQHYADAELEFGTVQASSPDPEVAYCQACGCPTGWRYSVSVRGDLDTLRADGWTEVDVDEPVGGTDEPGQALSNL